jgi:hypothetical protein
MADQEILAGLEETAEDSGTLGLIVYGNVGGNMQTVLSYTDTGPEGLAWLTGNFTGTGNDFTEIAQLWDDDGTLGLIVYGSPAGSPQALFTNPNMGQGSSALAFLAGNFTGSGTTEIAQLWDDDGILGLIVYGIGNGTLETVFTNPNIGQGSSALAFLTGNFIGSGYTQIAQTRDNNGTLQLLIYADIGNGSLSTVFSNDISQIPNALAWVTGDFTGTGNTQILRPWMTVFG